MTDVFVNMGVILLNFLAIVLYFFGVIILIFGPAFAGFLGWVWLADGVSNNRWMKAHEKLWDVLAAILALLFILFLYSVIFTYLPDKVWIGPWLPGDVWLGGLK